MNIAIALLCLASVAWIVWLFVAMKRRGKEASRKQRESDAEALRRLGSSLTHYKDKSGD